MNILIVPSWYQTDSNKIRGSFFKEQALALKNAGHHVVIAYVYLRTSRESFDTRLFRIIKTDIDGIDTYTYHVPSLGSTRYGTWPEKNVKYYRKLLQYVLGKEQIDLIHAHSFVPAGYAMTSLKEEFKIPVVVTEHFSGVLSHNLNSKQAETLCFTLSNADGIAAVSDALGNAMQTYLNTQIPVKTIPNMVSNIFYPNLTTNKKTTFFFVSIGGLIQIKRHNITISAFHEAFAMEENVELYIVGEGTERDKLQQQICDLGEEKRIFLTGRKSREEVAEFTRQMDAFVLPSTYETFGVVYIEAMASGLPVIGTKNGGYDEIYNEKCGYINDVDDVHGISDSMQMMRSNINKFDKRAISDYCQERFGEKKVVSMLEDWYEEVLS